jgi:trimeric autotransporter adhesin
MKTKTPLRAVALVLLLSLNAITIALAQGTAFTYQGRLDDGSGPANGLYDLRFALYDAPMAGTPQGEALTTGATAVSNGVFTVALDFGSQFSGADRWLEIGVRTNGGEPFAILSPRQALTPTPYAVYASGAASANAVAGSNIVGNIPAAQLPDDVALRSGGNTFSGDQIITAGNVGIGTGTPAMRLTVATPPDNYGIEHTDGTRRLSTYLAGHGAWFGTVSPDPLHFFVNDGSSALTIATNGNVGLGTMTPGANTLQINPAFHVAPGFGLQVNQAINGASIQINRGASQGGTGLLVDNSGPGDVTTSLLLLRNNVSSTLQNVLDVRAEGTTRLNGTLNLNTASFPGVTAFVRARPGDNLPLAVQGVNSINLLLVSSNGNATVSGDVTAAGFVTQGKIGIGTSSPGFPLNFASSMGDKISLWGSNGNHFGFGVQSSLLQIHTDISASDIAFGHGQSSNLTETVRFKGNGNVGIGTNNPTVRLDVNGDVRSSGQFLGNGSGLTSLSGAQLTTGTVADARLSTNIAMRAGNNTFAGNQFVNGNLVLNNATFPGVTLAVRHNFGSVATFLAQNEAGNPLFRVDPNGNSTTSGTAYAGAFVTQSDRDAKENFQPISPADVLAKVAALSIQRWNFKTDAATTHIGAMAQDFYAAFGVGPGDKHIATVDADGVALAAIQGLNQKVDFKSQKSEDRIQKLEAENAELKQSMNELKKLVGKLTRNLEGEVK